MRLHRPRITTLALNPMALFSCLWLGAIFLNSLKISNFQENFQPQTYIALYGSFISIWLGWVVGNLLFSSKKNPAAILTRSKGAYKFQMKAITVLIVLGVVAFFLKVALVGFVPMLQANKTEAYNQFNWGGPPVISIFFQIIGYCAVYRILLKLSYGVKINFWDAIPFLVEIIIDTLRGSRGPIVANMLILTFLLIAKNRLSVPKLLVFGIGIYVFIITLGVIRMDNFFDFVRIQGGLQIQEKWYDPYWVWPYLYIAMSVENVDFYLKYPSELTGGVMTFYAPISIFMLKRLFGASLNLNPDSDIGGHISSFNVGTYLDPYIKDFGLPGAVIMPFFVGIWIAFFYLKRNYSTEIFFGYLLTLAAAFFCFFYNEFWSVKNIFFILVLITIRGIEAAALKNR